MFPQMNPQMVSQGSGQPNLFAGLIPQQQSQQLSQQQAPPPPPPSQQQQQRQQSPQHAANSMGPLASLNPQQLQAMMQGSSLESNASNFNSAAIIGQNVGLPGQANSTVAMHNFNGLPGGVVDPSLLASQISMGNTTAMAGLSTSGMPFSVANGAMTNGIVQPHNMPQNIQPQRPPTASSQGDGTPEPAKTACRNSKGSATKKSKGAIKSEATSTPTIGPASIASQSPLGMTPDHSRHASVNAGRMQNFSGSLPGPVGLPPHLQQPQHQQPQQMQSAQSTPVLSGWTTSLKISQQQEIMSKAWEYAKAHNMNPADILARMDLLFVKAEQLPGGGGGASMPNGTAIITFDEARMLGISAPSSNIGVAAVDPGQIMTPHAVSSSAVGPMIPPQSPAAMSFGGHIQSPAGLPQHQSPAPQHLQQHQHPHQQHRARQASVANQPDPRSGFPTGAMGPPPQLGPAVRRPSVALDLEGQRGTPGISAAVSSPGAGLAEHLRKPSAQAPASALTAPLPGQTPTAGNSGGQLSGGVPNAFPAMAAPQPSFPSQPRPPPPNPNLPPVHGGALPPTTINGHKVTKLNTRITPLPNFSRPSLTEDDLNGASWQPMSEKDEQQLLAIMAKDAEYEEQIRQHMIKMHAALRSRVDELYPLRRRRSDGSVHQPEHLNWWERAEDENPIQVGSEGQFRIIFPDDRREELKAKRSGRSGLTSTFVERLKPQQLAAVGDKKEDLVPIRLEIDYEGWKLRDTFTWNSSDDLTSYDDFAKNLCEDYGLPEANFIPLIRDSLAVQIAEHIQTRALKPDSLEIGGGKSLVERDGTSRGLLSEKDCQWWKKWRETVRHMEEAAWGRRPMVTSSTLRLLEQNDQPEPQSQVERADFALPPVCELRISIKLDITVGVMNLIDQIEWDILDEMASPEAFARAFATDLGLAGEFETAIAHSIREQIDVHIRSLALAGYTFDGSWVSDEELKGAFLPEMVFPSAVTRVGQDVEDHTPRLLQLTEAEVDRLERERERENKRKRRQTRGRRGVNMPDRDPLKTQRTPIVCGLQAYQIELTGGAAAVAAATAGGSASLGGEFMPTIRSSTRRAAAAANAHLSSIAGDYDTPTPATEPRTSEGPVSSAKRQKLESHAVHFRYPGGLGRSTSEGPLFAPTLGAIVGGRGSSFATATAAAGGNPSSSVSRPAASPLRDIKASTSNSAASTPKNVRPEDVANQHPNMHDGQWYCSNCGAPGWLAAGRRKGPLGEKTLCGPCGKFWHRFRRMKQVQYTRDETFHRSQMSLGSNGTASVLLGTSTADEEFSSSLHTLSTAAPARGELTGDENIGGVGAFGRERKQPSTRGGSPDLPFQPVGSPSDSDSEPSQSPRVSRRDSPSKQRIVIKKSQSPFKSDGPIAGSVAPAAVSLEHNDSASARPVPGPAAPGLDALSPAPPLASPAAPEWLTQAGERLRRKYPQDRFELRAKGPGLWRIKCIDCPGKLYTPGPEESLTNFEVHLKNRAHRANVAARVEKSGKSGDAVAAAARGGGSPVA